MANRRRDPQKEAYWRGHVAGQAESGVSVPRYCREHGLSQPSFYVWRRELQRRDGEGGSPATAGGFVPVAVLPDECRAGGEPRLLDGPGRLEVMVSPGVVIGLREDVPEDVLLRVLSAVARHVGTVRVPGEDTVQFRQERSRPC